MIIMPLTTIVAFCVLYARGGQGPKWIKSWAAPICLTIALEIQLAILWSVSGKFLWFPALVAIAYTPLMHVFSYGTDVTDDKLEKKIYFRALCGLMPGICGLLFCIGTDHALIGVFQCLIAVFSSVFFGAFNPFSSNLKNWATILEDLFISFSYVCGVAFMVR